MDTDRVHSIAQFLTQVSIAILPIGVGASGLIAQQERTIGIWASIILVWIGLVIIAVSIYGNLDVLRMTPEDADDIIRHEEKLKDAINYFVGGLAVLLLSPIGLLFQSPIQAVELSRNEVVFIQSRTDPMSSNIVFTVSPAKESISIILENQFPYCIRANNLWNQKSTTTTTLFSTWEITADPSCRLGDYILSFNVLEDGYFIKSEQVTIRIVKADR